MKKILISTGGSGGHVVPATILYEHLKDDFKVYLSCDIRGTKFLNKKKYDLKIINTPRITKNFAWLPFQIFFILYLIIKSLFFLKNKKIDLIISTGGYMSLPLCLAAKIINIKIFLFEPNMVLGRVNRIFLKFCDKIFCYSNEIKNFPSKLKNKISLIPALLRKEFYRIKSRNLKTYVSRLNKNEINLLIIGGSQRAKLFDTVIESSIIELSKKYELKIFQQTSPNNFNHLKNLYLKKKIKSQLFDFNEDISNYMSGSDICITRAGASTLAELIFLNIPHIAIPLPSAKDNHQFENASFYQYLGCNWIIHQNKDNAINLTDKLLNIIENKDEYLDKKNKMKNLSYQNTWNNINQKLKSTINEN